MRKERARDGTTITVCGIEHGIQGYRGPYYGGPQVQSDVFHIKILASQLSDFSWLHGQFSLLHSGIPCFLRQFLAFAVTSPCTLEMVCREGKDFCVKARQVTVERGMSLRGRKNVSKGKEFH